MAAASDDANSAITNDQYIRLAKHLADYRLHFRALLFILVVLFSFAKIIAKRILAEHYLQIAFLISVGLAHYVHRRWLETRRAANLSRRPERYSHCKRVAQNILSLFMRSGRR